MRSISERPGVRLRKFAMSLIAVAFSIVSISSTLADTVKVPEDDPAITVDIPSSWKPESTDKGIACESPDKVATIIFEVTSAKELDVLIGENVDWLTKDQGVQVDKSSEQKGDFEMGNMKWSRISWDANSKEWGPAVVGFVFTDAGNGKILTVTYWITKKDQENHLPTVTKMFESVKRVGS